MVSIFKNKISIAYFAWSKFKQAQRLRGLSRRLYVGYTIFELVMVIALVGVIFFVTAPLMIEVGRSWQVAKVRNSMSENAMVAMDRVVREIRNCASVGSPSSNPSQSISINDINNNTITFSLSGNYLMRNANRLADNVSALSFTYSPSSIVVSMTFSLSGTSLNLVSEVYPRRPNE